MSRHGDRPDTAPLGQLGTRSATIVFNGARLAVSARADSRRAWAEPAALGVPDGLLAAGISGLPAGESCERRGGEAAASEVTIGVVPAGQERAQPVGPRGAGDGEVVAGTGQDPQRLAIAVDARDG